MGVWPGLSLCEPFFRADESEGTARTFSLPPVTRKVKPRKTEAQMAPSAIGAPKTTVINSNSKADVSMAPIVTNTVLKRTWTTSDNKKRTSKKFGGK